ncbi:MAG: hypothetical protein HUU50_10505 [Candidatus Brocadiae bacterium]|nr:hypothetical protein [Candidatus Brocadiia bacterium]
MRGIKFSMLAFFCIGCNIKEIESPFIQSLLESMAVFFSVVWENAFGISIALIFVSAFIGFICKARAVDKCMQAFANDKVTMANKTINWISGNFCIHSTGIELLFDKPKGNTGSFSRYSHIVYKNEFPGLFWIVRYQDNLHEKSQRKREKQIKITCNPGLSRRFSRYFRNLLGSFRDAFTQTISMILGQAQKRSPSLLLLKDQEKQISSIGADILGYVGNNYDPILENYIGRKVVVEITKDNKVEEICGIFKEYSMEFLLLLHVPLLENFAYEVDSKHPYPIHAKRDDIPLQLQILKGKDLEILSLSSCGIFLKSLQKENETCSLEKLLEPGQKMVVSLPGKLDGKQLFSLDIVRQCDLLLPRTHAMVRYSADAKKENWKSLIQVDMEFFRINKPPRC